MHDLDELSPCMSTVCSGPLARCDVRVKLIVALCTIGAVVASTRIWLPLAVLGASLAILLSHRVSMRAVARRLAGPSALAVMLCLLQGFMTGSTPVATLTLGPWHPALMREGLWTGLLIGTRVLGSVSAILVLCAAAPVESLMAALHWARVPRTWIEIGMLMIRYTFALSDQAASVLSAQKIRLGHTTLVRSLHSLGNLAGIVALRSLDQAERTHEAMIARGYQGLLPIPRLGPLCRRDRWVMAAGAAAIGSLLLLVERCMA